MTLNLQTLSHEPLVWSEDLPAGFKGVVLPGSACTSAIGEFGSICIQEFSEAQYAIRFNVFDIIQRFILRFQYAESGLYSRIMLKGRSENEINPDVKWALRRNQFVLMNAPHLPVISHYNKQLHISFDTFFSRD